MSSMNIRLDLPNKVYVNITKGSMYGFKLTIFKPIKGDKAKNPYSSNDLFFPTVDAVVKHLFWLGLDGESLESLVELQAKFYTNISHQIGVLVKSIPEEQVA